MFDNEKIFDEKSDVTITDKVSIINLMQQAAKI